MSKKRSVAQLYKIGPQCIEMIDKLYKSAPQLVRRRGKTTHKAYQPVIKPLSYVTLSSRWEFPQTNPLSSLCESLGFLSPSRTTYVQCETDWPSCLQFQSTFMLTSALAAMLVFFFGIIKVPITLARMSSLSTSFLPTSTPHV